MRRLVALAFALCGTGYLGMFGCGVLEGALGKSGAAGAWVEYGEARECAPCECGITVEMVETSSTGAQVGEEGGQ